MVVTDRERGGKFALRLVQGLGHLALTNRAVGDLFVVEELRLGLPDSFDRLDPTVSVERYRHERTQLDRLSVSVEDHELGRHLRGAAAPSLFDDLELRALDGDLVFLGELAGTPRAPFIARARLEAGGIADERTLLLSVYEVRIFGQSSIPAPALATELLLGLGLKDHLVGPTAAVLDPVGDLLLETCADLGWKVPSHDAVRLDEVRCEAGRISLVANRQSPSRTGLRSLAEPRESTTQTRRFLADYEAKTLYGSTENLISDRQYERAIATYERQLEVHPNHAFLVRRLMQLQVNRPEGMGEAVALAKGRLARYPDDFDAQVTLGVAQCRQGQMALAAETFGRVADLAERRGDPVEAAQARCAVASVLAESDPKAAVRALESAISLRRRLPGALRALAELYADAGDWAAALRTRERLLASEENPGTKRQMLVELGQIALERAGDVVTAGGYFERALELNREDVDALIGLADAQERLGRVLPALQTLDRAGRILQERGDGAAAADVMVRVGALWCAGPDADPSAAVLRFRTALMLRPGHPGALSGLADAAVIDGDPMRARHALEDLLRVAQEPGSTIDRAAVLLRLGDVSSLPGGDPLLAVTYYQKALDGPPECADQALSALETLYSRAERWDDVARVLELAIARVERPDVRGERLARLAQVVGTHLDDTARAVVLYEEAAEVRHDAPEILERLADLHRRAEQHFRLAQVLQRMANVIEDPLMLADIYAESGELLRIHLNQADEAIEAYSLALGCQPTHREALDGLADLYRERERYGELATILGRLAAVSEGVAAGRVWLELARLQGTTLDRPRDAVDSLEQARLSLPEDTEVLRLLGDYCFEGGRLERALAQYTRLSEIYDREGYDEPAAPFLTRMAEVLDALGRPEEAVRHLRRAMEADPDRLDVYERAQDVLLRQGDVEGITEFFKLGLDAAMRPSIRRVLAKRAGRLLWRELRRPSDAMYLFDEVLRYDPSDADVRGMLLEVATALADWPRVAALLREQLESAATSERPTILTNLAKLAYTELGRPDEGTRLALAALSEQPDHVPALTLLGERAYLSEDWENVRRAYLVLESLEGRMGRPEDVYRLALSMLRLGDAAGAVTRLEALRGDGHVYPGLLSALVEGYVILDDALNLSRELDAWLDTDVGGPAADAMLRRIARVLTGDDSTRVRGLECWTEVRSRVADDAEAIAALHAWGGLPEPALESIPPEVLLPIEPPASESVEVPPQSATPKDDEVVFDADDAAEVLAALEAALPDEDSEPPAPGVETEAEEETDLPPLEARRVISAEDHESPERVRDALREKIGETEDALEQSRLWLELAEHQRDRLHDPEGAIPMFTEALDKAQPGDTTWNEAIETLEDLRAIRAEWDDLLALYDRRLDAGVGAGAEVHLLKASILRAAGRRVEAIEAAEQALPVGERALDLLVALLSETGQHVAAADRLLDDVDALSAADRAYRQWRAAELLAQPEPARALTLFAEAAVRIDDPALVEAWSGLARSEGEPSMLFAALEAQIRQSAGDGPEAMRRSRYQLEASQLASSSLDDWAAARALCEQSLASWPDNVDALVHLGSILEHLGDDEALAANWTHQLDALLPGRHRSRLAGRLVGLLEELGVPEGKIAPYRSIMAEIDVDEHVEVEVLPAPPEPSAGRPRALAEKSNESIVTSLVEQGEALLHDPDALLEAVSLLEDALGLDPSHRQAYALLARLYDASGMPEELSGVLERHATAVGAGPDRANLLLQRGRIAEVRLKDVNAASASYLRALGEPLATLETTGEALDALIGLTKGTGEEERVREALDERLAHAVDPTERSGLLVLRARLWWKSLGHVGRARADLEAAVKTAADHGPAHLLLARLADERGDVEDAADHFDRALRSHGATSLTDNQREDAFAGFVRAEQRLDRGVDVVERARAILTRHPECRAARAVVDSRGPS